MIRELLASATPTLVSPQMSNVKEVGRVSFARMQASRGHLRTPQSLCKLALPPPHLKPLTLARLPKRSRTKESPTMSMFRPASTVHSVSCEKDRGRQVLLLYCQDAQKGEKRLAPRA